MSSRRGGCVIISKDDEYTRYFFTLYLTTDTNVKPRLYLKIDIIALEKFPRLAKQVVTDSITPDEVLVQANKIFAPYTLKFATPLSRFAVWKISKGVARSFSSHDLGVHLVGDVDHVHSVRGAFALNGSIMNAANLAWKLGLCALDLAPISPLHSTYSLERRAHAARIIRVSSFYLRFICNSALPMVKKLDNDINTSHDDGPEYNPTSVTHTPEDNLAFLKYFFTTHGHFLLGLNASHSTSVLTTPALQTIRAIGPLNGVRAPNPRICFSPDRTGYLYNMMAGASTMHVLLFLSTFLAPFDKALCTLDYYEELSVVVFQIRRQERFNIILSNETPSFRTRFVSRQCTRARVVQGEHKVGVRW